MATSPQRSEGGEDLVALLQAMFPHMEPQVVRAALEASGGNGDMAAMLLQMLEAPGGRSGGSTGKRQSDFDPSIDAPFLSNVPSSPTIVEPHGEYGGSCGYCHGTESQRISFGMTGHRVRIDDFEAMQDQGWSRSGTWLYYPSNEKTCWLDVNKFVPSSDQKRVLKKMQRFLSDINNTPENFHSKGHAEDESAAAAAETEPMESEREEDPLLPLLTSIIRQAVQASIEADELQPLPHSQADIAIEIDKARHEKERKRKGDYSSNVAFKLFALYSRASGDKQKGKAVEGEQESKEPKQKKPKKGEKSKQDTRRTIEIAAKLLPRIERLLRSDKKLPGLLGEQSVRATTAGSWINFFLPDSYRRASITPSHESDLRKARKDKEVMREDQPPPTPHRLETEIGPAVFTEESYQLYRKYTTTIHDKTEPTRKSYTNFLCSPPFIPDSATLEPKPVTGYGSFHQYYRLDGKLIAVGVLDVFQRCLKSVYFFYDPDYSFLSLGVYSALKEIEWVKEQHKTCPEFKYYYMAYFIYDCPKMNYKAKYRPSDLMCPVYREWVPLDQCLPQFEASGGRFTQLIVREEPPRPPERLPIDQVPILHDGFIVGFNQIRGRLRARIKPLVQQWCERVSADIASRVVLAFD